MTDNRILADDAWLAERKVLLEREKEFTRARDALTEARQQLPWRRVEKEYVFDSSEGDVSLHDLFGRNSQLLVQHFMFEPDWHAGCKSCSMMADHINPSLPHLPARDVSFVAISRAPLEKLHAYRERMGWGFEWVSSLGSEFNYDFNVSFKQSEIEADEVTYNYKRGYNFPGSEAPGLSTFARGEDGAVFHTYSVYARGLENTMGIYNLLDLVPRGRDEGGLDFAQAWFRRHDEYCD